MKQTKLINIVVEELIQRKYLNCCYLGGSFGRHQEDNYSNVDLYCNFIIENEEDYEKNKLSIFEKYGTIVYNKKQDGIDIIVFEDGLLFRLHHILINRNGNIEIDQNYFCLYDPYGILNTNNTNSLEFSEEEIGRVIDQLSIHVLEFSRNFLKNEYPVLLHLASSIHEEYSSIKHYIKNSSDAKLSSKNIMLYLDNEERSKYIEILRYYSFDKLKSFIQLILEDLTEILVTLPVTAMQCFNYDFFEFAKKRIEVL